MSFWSSLHHTLTPTLLPVSHLLRQIHCSPTDSSPLTSSPLHPLLFVPHHYLPPLNLWTSHIASTHRHSNALIHPHTFPASITFPLVPLCLTSGEVALLPYADLGGVDQVANRNSPPHRGSYAGVTGAALVHLQQGQVWGGATCHRHHIVTNTIWGGVWGKKQEGGESKCGWFFRSGEHGGKRNDKKKNMKMINKDTRYKE